MREQAGGLIDRIRRCIAAGQTRVSSHGYDELAADGLFFGEVLAGFASARLIERYPECLKGPCVLLLQSDSTGAPAHVLWGIPRGQRVSSGAGDRLPTRSRALGRNIYEA